MITQNIIRQTIKATSSIKNEWPMLTYETIDLYFETQENTDKMKEICYGSFLFMSSRFVIKDLEEYCADLKNEASKTYKKLAAAMDLLVAAVKVMPLIGNFAEIANAADSALKLYQSVTDWATNIKEVKESWDLAVDSYAEGFGNEKKRHLLKSSELSDLMSYICAKTYKRDIRSFIETKSRRGIDVYFLIRSMIQSKYGYQVEDIDIAFNSMVTGRLYKKLDKLTMELKNIDEPGLKGLYFMMFTDPTERANELKKIEAKEAQLLKSASQASTTAMISFLKKNHQSCLQHFKLKKDRSEREVFSDHFRNFLSCILIEAQLDANLNQLGLNIKNPPTDKDRLEILQHFILQKNTEVENINTMMINNRGTDSFEGLQTRYYKSLNERQELERQFNVIFKKNFGRDLNYVEIRDYDKMLKIWN